MEDEEGRGRRRVTDNKRSEEGVRHRRTKKETDPIKKVKWIE